MIEITNANQDTPESQPAKPVRTLEALLELYEQGYRNFSGSDLRGVTIDILDKEITQIDLSRIILKDSNLTCAIFYRTNITLKVDLFEADFSNCNLQGASLFRSKLTGANFSNSNLQGVNLSQSKIDQCNFNNSCLSGANLTYSSCRGSDFIKAILQNVRFDSSDFTASDFTETNFSRSTLPLSGTFTAANFTRANLRSTSLSGQFTQTNFSEANLQSAKIGSTFIASNLSGANLRSASLSGDFSQANFSKSNLSKSILKSFTAQGIDFSDADLQVSEVSNVTLKYCYYNSKTKFSECIDPVASGMELIEDEIESED